MSTFFTSDLHFNHDKNFLWGARGFISSEEHDEEVIRRWNEIVSSDDTVYVLGDVIMGLNQESGIEKLSRLNGKIIIIKGNHDTDNKFSKYLTNTNVLEETKSDTLAKIIKSSKWRFYISHRPTIMDVLKIGRHDDGGIENESEKMPKEWCLHGHSHSKDKFQYAEFCCYNVALDAHDCRPVSIEQIKEDIRNYIEELLKQEN